MGSRERRKKRHRIRGRTSRKLRTTLVVAGVVMLLIGAGTFAWGLIHQMPPLRIIGLVYMFLAVVVLAARQAMVAISAQRHARGDDDEAEDAESAGNADANRTGAPDGARR